MTNEKSIVNQLSEEVKTEKKRSEKLQKHLEDERKNLEEICLKGKAKNDEQEEVKEKLKQVREERDRLIKVCDYNPINGNCGRIVMLRTTKYSDIAVSLAF